MDSSKLSLSSKVSHVNSVEGNDSPKEERLVSWQNSSVEGERQKDMESKETEGAEVTSPAAEINHHHKGSADKQKFGTLTYQRRPKQKVVTTFASVSKGTSAGVRSRAALRQVLFNQGASDKNPPSEERGQLDVLKQELGVYAVPVSLTWKWNEENQGTTLEKNWTDIVQSHSTMAKMQRHQQEALWEFVHTELTYINRLIIIRDLVIAALVNLNQHGFLLEVTPEVLFSNLPSIISAHQLFWQEVVYPMLHEVRRTGQPFDPLRLEAGCLQFHERFAAYQHYCWEEANNLEFARRQMESNPHFLTYVQWVETHPQCERMQLGNMQAQPHQRITKYPLLLKAVLKTTQDPHVQHKVRGMLSGVKSFVERINDYLRFKDEELALSISAQRVEGYEVEGINEEIDKHVKEISQFNLTCPISGVGPNVVRKLLLEENLKIRARKDSKLEVVALLFSDVLLITKVQKKGERLKVFRPPLALDRTYCIALKDGCSFVLVEVGELQSAMNVYIFATSTPESCSTWVSTIHQAKETLSNQRERELNRQLENWKIQQWAAKSVTEARTDDLETEEQPLTESGEKTFVNELADEITDQQPINGMWTSKEAKDEHQPPNAEATNSTELLFRQSQLNSNNRKLANKSFLFPGRQQAVKGCEWIEMGVREGQGGKPVEDEEKIVESQMTNEQRMTFNLSAPNLGNFITAANAFKYSTTGRRTLLLEQLPDVDYPTNEDSALQPPDQPTVAREGPEYQSLPKQRKISTRRNSGSQSVNQDTRRYSRYSHSEDMETFTETRAFSKNLQSPGAVSTHQSPSPQTSKHFFQDSTETSASNNYDSKSSLNNKQNSSQSSDSHRVLKLGFLKLNQGMFWGMDGRISPDLQTMSDQEADLNSYNRRPKMKSQRRASIPNIITEGEQRLHLPSSSRYPLPQEQDTASPVSGQGPYGLHSPLEGLLERAKGRDGLKRERHLKVASVRPRYSPSLTFSTTPSLPPIDGDRDTEWEEEVELMRHRALTVSKGWKEQLVDGDEDERRNSVAFLDGVNVDWSGWCFDDDEVMDHIQPGEEGLLEGISRSLAYLDFSQAHEDGACSEV